MRKKRLCIYLNKLCFVMLVFLSCYCLYKTRNYFLYVDDYSYKHQHYHFEEINRLKVNEGWIFMVNPRTTNEPNQLQMNDGTQWNIYQIQTNTSSSRDTLNHKDALKEATLDVIRTGAKFIYITSQAIPNILATLARFSYTQYMWSLRYRGSSSLYHHFTTADVPGDDRHLDQLYQLGVWRTAPLQNVFNQGGITPGQETIIHHNDIFDLRTPVVSLQIDQYLILLKDNTLFHYDAFWAIYSLHGHDYIWSLWVQRLLQELGKNPVSHIGTEGKKSRDIEYNHMTNKLTNWNCDKKLDFFGCVLALSRFMANQHIIQQTEFYQISLWLENLTHAGYRIPQRHVRSSDNSLEPVHRVLYSPSPPTKSNFRNTTFNNICNNGLANCPVQISLNSTKRIDNILVVIVFNRGGHYHIVDYLEKLYRPVFQHILYCGTDMDEFLLTYKRLDYPVSFIEMHDDFQVGQQGYQCLQNAMRMNYDVQGYLHLSDDVLLNLWNIHKLPTDRIWFQESMCVANLTQPTVPDVWRHPTWWPWESRLGRQQLVKVMKELRSLSANDATAKSFLHHLAQNSGSSDRVFYEVSDIFYIPNHLKKEFLYITSVFDSYQVYLEIAVPNIINGLDKQSNIIRLRGDYLWYEDRVFLKETFSYNSHFLHPLKIGTCLVDDECVQFLCESYLPCV